MYLKSLGIIWDVKEKKRIIVILFFCGAGGTIPIGLDIFYFTYFYFVNI
ncbi:hypothetical protein EAVVTKC53_01368 [Elizabethkingia anophelis]|nr:hypothetical protein EAVVTKC53_03221 [Elizabethkingia anophelis]CAI9680535.1 hypothetical protein EAVVTKC53_01368 [Elizabethkingia anophelis]